jgi:GPH family glycoside/pentoside/hexuronide:cation symporter
VIEPSIKADVIDYDELATGQRKEGAYLSVWSFMQKASMGLAAIILGAVLQWVGFEANVEQPEHVKTALMALFGLLPGAACFFAAWVFHGFKMTETEHNAVRASIDPGFVPK